MTFFFGIMLKVLLITTNNCVTVTWYIFIQASCHNLEGNSQKSIAAIKPYDEPPSGDMLSYIRSLDRLAESDCQESSRGHAQSSKANALLCQVYTDMEYPEFRFKPF